jgi:truncated hemoglobin YjbI/ankyrin repeat protein
VTSPSLAHRAVGALPTSVATDRIGNADELEQIAARLYDGIEGDPAMRRKFGSDLADERRKLGAFLTELLLDEPKWNGLFAHGDLAGPHRFIHITEEDAGRWLGHARRAAVEVVGEAAAKRLVDGLRPIALALVNEADPPAPRAKREARFAPTRAAIDACARGDLARVRELLDDAPRLVAPSEPGSAELLHAAVAKGRSAVVEELVVRGVDVNKPARAGALMVSALCVARLRRRGSAPLVALLEAAGALDDPLTSAYLGEVDALDDALRAEPALANEPDPASDFFASTVVDHAVLGRCPEETLAVAVAHGARSPRHGHQLLHHAAANGRLDVVGALLAIGADATKVTAGRWVLQTDCARLLLDAGADVNHAPTRWQSWAWRSCTGNHGNRDDPDYVQALLDAGADVHTVVFDKTPLELATRAGFTRTVEVLRAAGA